MSAGAQTDCLSLERLEALLLGSPLDAVQAAHLDACPACRGRVAELRANNDLLKDVIATAKALHAAVDGDVAEPPGAPVKISGYDILGEIRHGGQGIVYKAVQRATRRTVAVKVLLEGRLALQARRQRFEREIEVVAALRHPFIVTIYDSGLTADGRLFFAMEFVAGLPLDEYVAQHALSHSGSSDPSVLPLADALGLFCGICEGVNHAHQRGVIHRDIKPSNILIDAEKRPHIVDFGIAKAVGGDGPETQRSLITAAGQFMGTLAYAAPEQLSGDPNAIDVRTDVYALGVILFELLTGRLPYPPAATLSETVRAITDAAPIPPSGTHSPHRRRSSALGAKRIPAPIDNDLDTIVLRALAKDPQRRYQTAGAFGEDVHRYVRGDPIDARRDNSWYVLKKAIRRHRLSAALSAVFLVLLIAFGLGMSLMYRRSRLEAEKAKQIKVFLEDTLSSVEQSRQGADVTVRQMLDESVHWVEIALHEQPEVEASLRTTIGNSYRSLGLYNLAERELTLALQVHRRLFGEEHPLVAQSLNAMGALARDRGDLPSAMDFIQQGLAMRRRLLGEGHFDVTVSLQNLASVLVQMGDFASGGSLLRESLSIRQQLYSHPHPDVAMAQFELAEVLRGAGDVAEAEVMHRAALKTRQTLLHDEHPDVARSLLALGRTLLGLGRPEEAEPLFRQCLERQARVVPVNPLRLADAQGELSHCLSSQRRFEEAEELVLQSYNSLRSALGETDPRTIQALEHVIALYNAWGKPAEVARFRAMASH